MKQLLFGTPEELINYHMKCEEKMHLLSLLRGWLRTKEDRDGKPILNPSGLPISNDVFHELMLELDKLEMRYLHEKLMATIDMSSLPERLDDVSDGASEGSDGLDGDGNETLKLDTSA